MPPVRIGDVFEHRLAAVAKARRLDGSNLQAAAQLVDDQRRKRLAFNVLRDDQQRLARLHSRFEHRQKRLQVGQFLLVDQDVGIFEFDAHLVRIGDEIRRQIAAVELHALDNFELGLGGLGFLDGDHALVADLLHGFGKEAADLGIAIGRDGADLRDLVVVGDVARLGLQFLHNRLNRLVDAALEVHRVHARRHGLRAFLDDCVRENGRGRGAIASNVAGLRCDRAHHLRAHVLELVLQFDLLRHGHAVLGDAGRAKRFVQDHIAAFRAERDLHRIGENFDAAQHLVARLGLEFHFFCSHLPTPSTGNIRCPVFCATR